MRKRIPLLVAAIVLCGVSSAAGEVKNCEELKTEIAAKLDAKGVKNYTLEIVAPADAKDQKIVGSCDGGSKQITYRRN